MESANSFNDRLQSLIVQLYDIGALKFGNFKMKVGINSPVYFDLRVIVSYPTLMDTLSHLMWEFSRSSLDPFDHICGVPYTALPIASLISVQASIPMLIRRKETKDYGTRKLIEGNFKKGDKCLIIEDVVTSGSSILDTYRDLKNEDLLVSEAIVVVDRQQGGIQNLLLHGLKMKSLCTLSQVMDTLLEKGRVDQHTVDQVRNYTATNQIPLNNYVSTEKAEGMNRLTMNFTDRAKHAKNSVGIKLLKIMSDKQTNLCLAADSIYSKKILELAADIGPYICLLKIHVDIIEDFSQSFVEKLVAIAEEKNFLIMEDRKFADIGHVAKQQYSEGVYKIASWADLVTVHPLPGPGILEGLKTVLAEKIHVLERGCFLVMEMSTQGNLNTAAYKTGALKVSADHTDFVTGFVCQSPSLVSNPGMLQLTPGVQLLQGNDSLGQQYNTPEHVVINCGADIAVVGRGITEAADAVSAAQEFQAQLWKAYEKRVAKKEVREL